MIIQIFFKVGVFNSIAYYAIQASKYYKISPNVNMWIKFYLFVF